jgi:hypothetical protein
MSGDPEQEYFADGMVEEIITALSRIRWLFVIARNSAFVLLTAHRDDPATGVMTGLCSDCAQKPRLDELIFRYYRENVVPDARRHAPITATKTCALLISSAATAP